MLITDLVFDTLCAPCHDWPIHLNVIWIQTRGLWWEYHTLTNSLFTKTVRFWVPLIASLPHDTCCSSVKRPHLILSPAASSLHISLLGEILCLCLWVEQAGSLRWFLGGVWGLLWSSSSLFVIVSDRLSDAVILHFTFHYLSLCWKILAKILSAGFKKQKDPNYFWISFKGRLTRPTVLHCQAPLSIQGCRY